MVFFNYALRKLNAKIVYYGPGLCGKTTNLQWIHDHFEGGQKGKMISLATEGDRTIFFDLLPIEIGTIRGMDVTLQLYTVPGQVHYNSTRQLVLRGADGVVFVADSQRTMQASNRDAFKNLEENLRLQGIEIASFPHVLQFNKRDLRDLLPLEDLDADLNQFGVPFFEAIATDGVGVQETLEGIVKLVMRSLRERYEQAGVAAGAPRNVAAPPAPGLRPPAPGPVAPPRAPAPPVSPIVPPRAPAPSAPAVAPPRAPAAPPSGIPPRSPVAPVAPPRSPVPPAPARGPAAPGAAMGTPGAPGIPHPPSHVDPAPPPKAASLHHHGEPIEDEIRTADFREAASPSSWPPPPEASFEDAPTGVQSSLEDIESAEMRLDDAALGGAPDDLGELDLPRSTLAFEPPGAADLVEPPPRESAIPFEPGIDDEFASAPTETGLEVGGLEEIRIDDEGGRFDGPSFGDLPLEEDEVAEPDGGPEDGPSWEAGEQLEAPAFQPAPSASSYLDEIRAPSPFVRRTEASVDVPLTEPSPFDLPGFSDEPSGATEFLTDGTPGSEPDVAEWTPAADVAEGWGEPGPAEDLVPSFDEPEEEPAFDFVDEGPVSVGMASPGEEAVPSEPPPPAPQPPSVEPERPPERPAPPPPASRPRQPAPAVDDLVASVLGDRGRAPAARPTAAPTTAPAPPSVAARTTPEPGVVRGHEPSGAPFREAPLEPTPPTDHHAEPVLVGDGDPFADEPEPVVVQPSAVMPAVPGASAPPPLAIHAHDNQLQVRLQGTGAIAESGQVRELDIQVPVPGSWVGNRRVTLQLRLTLMPAPEDENGGNGGPA